MCRLLKKIRLINRIYNLLMNIDVEYCKKIENIVIVPSYIGSTNSVYSKEQRYEQTKVTLKSIREKIPNCFIAFIDITEFTEEQYNYIKDNCDLFCNETFNEELKKKVLMNKSYGELSYIHTLLNLLNNNETEYNFKMFPNYKAIFKVGGRYYLNEYFDYNKYDIDKDICSLIALENGWRAAHSCLYKIHKSNIIKFINYINNFSDYILNKNVCMEEFMYYYYESILSIEHYNKYDILGMTAFNTNNFDTTYI